MSMWIQNYTRIEYQKTHTINSEKNGDTINMIQFEKS